MNEVETNQQINDKNDLNKLNIEVNFLGTLDRFMRCIEENKM